jgi:succinoglycan biosynthesis protein ExoO
VSAPPLHAALAGASPGGAGSGSVPGDAVRVSVLIPLYNSESTIERAVRSALAQTLQDLEVLVADDASTDGGAAIVEAIAREDGRVRLLRLPANRGKPHAMNVMISVARGAWLAVLDADDAYHPARLELLIRGALAANTAMAADNLNYIDSGVYDPDGFGAVVRQGFDPEAGDRILEKQDMLRDSSSFASFDYGVLKPVIRRDFVEAHALCYDESSRLAEDFTYLLEYFVAGGTMYLTGRALYDWTMPFGAISRRWTSTGAGAWRYDYRPALAANQRLMRSMRLRGEIAVVALLEKRGRQYRAMTYYIDAQRAAEVGRWRTAISCLLRHPVTWGLLARRILGRAWRVLRAAPSSRRSAA